MMLTTKMERDTQFLLIAEFVHSLLCQQYLNIKFGYIHKIETLGKMGEIYICRLPAKTRLRPRLTRKGSIRRGAMILGRINTPLSFNHKYVNFSGLSTPIPIIDMIAQFVP